jgi:predicted cation transporter
MVQRGGTVHGAPYVLRKRAGYIEIMNTTDLLPWQYAALFALFGLVLVLPIAIHRVESNIEAFLFACGAAALTISSRWSGDLLHAALLEPFPITATVLFFGVCFYFGRERLDRALAGLNGFIPVRWRIFLIVVILGFLSSAITAVIASLILVEVVRAMKFPRRYAVQVIVLACFAIGMGAALTPIGEPLSAIVTTQMRGDFLYLARTLSIYIVPGVVLIGAVAAALPEPSNGHSLPEPEPETSVGPAVIRAVKVYVFVGGLVMLGAAFEPVAMRYIVPLSGHLLFWVNIVSAAMDNATLAAAEATPSLHPSQLSAALLGLLTSGGILIPGNIPNIVASGSLRITSREWARVGVPAGLAIMLVTFAAWYLIEGRTP